MGVSVKTQVQIPGYKIIKKLGQGGMASVYLALQESVNRKVALKVMTPVLAADPSFSDRFLREAQIAARLHHPGIVTVFDVGVVDNYHYIAMQYQPGGKLTRSLIHDMKVAQALEICKEIAKALEYAHDKAVIHRDVKTDNILFDEYGHAVLSDFGIAKATDSNTHMTATGSIIGTPHYMSPEQARGQQVTGAADIYSLGIVLYELLTGDVPYRAEDTLGVCVMHVNDPVPALPVARAQLQPLINRMLAKKPEDRFSHAKQLYEAIEAISFEHWYDVISQSTPADLEITAPGTTRDVPSIQHTPKTRITQPGQAKSSNIIWWLSGFVLMAVLAASWVYMNPQSTPKFDYTLQAELMDFEKKELSLPPTLENAKKGVDKLQTLYSIKKYKNDPALAASTRQFIEQWIQIQKSWTAEQRDENPQKLLDVLQPLLVLPVNKELKSEITAFSENDASKKVIEPVAPSRDQESILALAKQKEAEGNYFGEKGALQNYALLEDEKLRDESLTKALAALEGRLGVYLQEKDFTQAESLLQQMTPYVSASRLVELQAKVTDRKSAAQNAAEQDKLKIQIAKLLASASQDEIQDRLTLPEGDNAYEKYLQVLTLDNSNQTANEGVVRIGERLLELALRAESEGQHTKARDLWDRGRRLAPQSTLVQKLKFASGAETSAKREQSQQLEKINDPREATARAKALLRSDEESAIRLVKSILHDHAAYLPARKLLSQLAQKYALLGEFNIDHHKLVKAQKLIEKAENIDPGDTEVKRVKRKLAKSMRQTGQANITEQTYQLRLSAALDTATKYVDKYNAKGDVSSLKQAFKAISTAQASFESNQQLLAMKSKLVTRLNQQIEQLLLADQKHEAANKLRVVKKYAPENEQTKKLVFKMAELNEEAREPPNGG
ncbi:MAG: protein kinase domain-containing protein [bacterium]